MNLETERMCHAGHPRPEEGKGFGGILEDGFYINYLHGLDYLCRKYITKNMSILELGSFYGSSSELFSEYSNNVTCVDIQYYPEMAEVVERKKISFVQADSVEFLKNIDYGSYDLIYIDTTHELYRSTEEITLAYSKTKEGQYIAGHDYTTNGSEVSKAILEIFEYPDLEVFLDSSWVIQHNNRLKLKNK